MIAFEAHAGGWLQHTLATGFKVPRSLAPGQGGPGAAVPFMCRGCAGDKGKPWLIVSGDDNGTVTQLTPRSADKADWGYDAARVATGSGTVGSTDVADIDGDGWVEVAVPMYKDNQLRLYTYAPQ